VGNGVCIYQVPFFKRPSPPFQEPPCIGCLSPYRCATHAFGRIAQNESACFRALSHGSGYTVNIIDLQTRPDIRVACRYRKREPSRTRIKRCTMHVIIAKLTSTFCTCKNFFIQVILIPTAIRLMMYGESRDRYFVPLNQYGETGQQRGCI
jgi:hypothetical protein